MMNDAKTLGQMIDQYERLRDIELERADDAGSHEQASLYSSVAATWAQAAAMLRAAIYEPPPVIDHD
jgi:hypothetical protein